METCRGAHKGLAFGREERDEATMEEQWPHHKGVSKTTRRSQQSGAGVKAPASNSDGQSLGHRTHHVEGKK